MSRTREPLTDLAGAPRGSLGLVPRLYVSRTLRALADSPPLPLPERLRAIQEAAGLFEHGSPGGEPRDAYLRALTEISGVPEETAQRSVAAVATALRSVAAPLAAARPSTAIQEPVPEGRPDGGVLWARRGHTFAVLAAGNTPGVHSLWPESLALGYRVAVRPSRREPFTPRRLVRALCEAGMGAHVALLPSSYEVADHLVQEADFSLVYGGQEVVDKYSGNPRVILQGPGRSKIVVTADTDWREHLETIRHSVAAMGGAACTCTSAVLVQDGHRDLARSLAEVLAPSGGSAATGPAMDRSTAEGVLGLYARTAASATPVLRPEVVPGARGGWQLTAAVSVLENARDAALSVELPFPCVWVAPYDGELAPLRNSLVLTALTRDLGFVQKLEGEPTIRNVYAGPTPTTWMTPGVPHDGFLSEHLMGTKGVKTPPGWSLR